MRPAVVREVTLVCPGFAVDCLETLEEIDIENRDVFMRAGGERYQYVPALTPAPAMRMPRGPDRAALSGLTHAGMAAFQRRAQVPPREVERATAPAGDFHETDASIDVARLVEFYERLGSPRP